MDPYQTIFVFAIFATASDTEPEVRLFRTKEAAKAAFRTWLTLACVDEDGNSMDKLGRTIDHCVRDGNYYGPDGMECFVFDREIE